MAFQVLAQHHGPNAQFPQFGQIRRLYRTYIIGKEKVRTGPDDGLVIQCGIVPYLHGQRRTLTQESQAGNADNGAIRTDGMQKAYVGTGHAHQRAERALQGVRGAARRTNEHLATLQAEPAGIFHAAVRLRRSGAARSE